jgi:cytochrome c
MIGLAVRKGLWSLAVVSTCAIATSALAQDAKAGANVFKRCAVCHATSASAPPKMGPTLAGVVGRRAGSVAKYSYSKAMSGSKFTWDASHLDQFLTKPQQTVKGTKMIFVGLPKPKDRQDLIAYLKTLKGGR